MNTNTLRTFGYTGILVLWGTITFITLQVTARGVLESSEFLQFISMVIVCIAQVNMLALLGEITRLIGMTIYGLLAVGGFYLVILTSRNDTRAVIAAVTGCVLLTAIFYLLTLFGAHEYVSHDTNSRKGEME